MESPAAAPSAAPAAAPAEPATFMEAIAAAQAAPASAEPAALPPTEATPVPVGSAPAPVVAPDANAWVKELGDYQSPADVKAALATIDTLKASQLTDDQRALLKLTEDPTAWREFNELTHMGDLKDVADEDVLFRAFMRERPGADPEDARFLFEQEQDRKYPGLAEAPTERAHKAHLAERAREANAQRTALTTQRDARLADLKKGALPAAGPTPEQVQAQRDTYLVGVDKLLGEHPEGYKMQVPVGDSTLNLAVESKDLPALKAIIADPMRALASEDGKFLDPQKLMRFAAFMQHGDTLLADAYKAGQTGSGPQVSVAELHNATGATPNPAVGGDGSFLSALQQAAPARPKVQY